MSENILPKAPRLTRSMKNGRGKPDMPFNVDYELAVLAVEKEEEDLGYHATERTAEDEFYQNEVKHLIETGSVDIGISAITLGRAQEISYITSQYGISAPIAIRVQQLLAQHSGKGQLVGMKRLQTEDISHLVDMVEAEIDGSERILPQNAPITHEGFKVICFSDLGMEDRLHYTNLAHGIYPERELQIGQWENVHDQIEDAGAQGGFLH